MISTVQGPRPIPPAVTVIGDPNGHHEVPEPNFSSTRPCRGCSPVFEIPATGWLDTPVAEQHGSTFQEPTAQVNTGNSPQATITAGASDIVISQDPSGGGIVVGSSYTLLPGDTITIGDTPVAIETSDGKTKIVAGTTIISLLPFQSATTDAPTSQPPIPLPPILTIGTKTIAPNSQTQYVTAGQTLSPGGETLTISGTTLALAPFATALVINGKTSSIIPVFGDVYTTVTAALTYKDHIYTPNRAGYIVMGPGTTLVPGGAPITVNGTTLSLDHSGTAVVVQGATRTLHPVTTTVTLTRAGPDPLGTGSGVSGGSYHGQSTGYLYPTGDPIIAGTVRAHSTIASSWPAGLLLLVWWGMGYLAIRP
ncbi:hypothetical protein G6011_08016 [Alternaria panax]|uniref:Uncharacterized protein n=1 Tax=Alternaria panax TaxID=48097 RepID=A0AAD4I4X8_9PLEO|nr:hypothetical protein G6011_08016 [Alternaria panax]